LDTRGWGTHKRGWHTRGWHTAAGTGAAGWIKRGWLAQARLAQARLSNARWEGHAHARLGHTRARLRHTRLGQAPLAKARLAHAVGHGWHRRGWDAHAQLAHARLKRAPARLGHTHAVGGCTGSRQGSHPRGWRLQTRNQDSEPVPCDVDAPIDRLAICTQTGHRRRVGGSPARRQREKSATQHFSTTTANLHKPSARSRASRNHELCACSSSPRGACSARNRLRRARSRI
jgi:hypothetical protein